jgi:cellobiose phosphorylase
MIVGNYFNEKVAVQTNVTDVFCKLKTFSDSIEKVLVKDKKFGFMEESILETKLESSKTANTGMSRAEITQSRHEDAKFNRMAAEAAKYLKLNQNQNITATSFGSKTSTGQQAMVIRKK